MNYILGTFDRHKVIQIMPAVSSLATKVLSHDKKVSIKVSLKILECWEKIMKSFISGLKVSDNKEEEVQILIKLMKVKP